MEVIRRCLEGLPGASRWDTLRFGGCATGFMLKSTECSDNVVVSIQLGRDSEGDDCEGTCTSS